MSNSPEQKLKRLINGFQVSQAIHVAATLGVANHLDGGPLTSAQLGTMTGSHPGTLYRLLRALGAAGVFHEDDEGRFSLTPVGAALRTDSPNSRGAWACLVADRRYGNPGASCSTPFGRAKMRSCMGAPSHQTGGRRDFRSGHARRIDRTGGGDFCGI